MSNYKEFKQIVDGFLAELVNLGGSKDLIVEICKMQLSQLEYDPNEQLENNIRKWMSEQSVSI